MAEAPKAAGSGQRRIGQGWEQIWKARIRARANLASNMLDYQHRALSARADRIAAMRAQITNIERAVTGDEDDDDDDVTNGGGVDTREDPRP